MAIVLLGLALIVYLDARMLRRRDKCDIDFF